MSAMKTVLIGLLFMSYVALNQAQVHTFVNDYLKPFDYNCSDGKIVGGLYSEYDSTYRDRKWEIRCIKVKSTTQCVRVDPKKLGYSPNDFEFICPGYKLLSGIASYINSSSGIHMYKFTCCLVPGVDSDIENCGHQDVNKYGGPLNYNEGIPLEYNEILGSGIYHITANHLDYYNDKRFNIGGCMRDITSW